MHQKRRNVTTSQKATFSLLIAVFLFGAFLALAFTGLFDLLEARFYNPSVTARLNRDIAQSAEAIDKFFAEAQARFSETLKTDTVRRSFLSYRSVEDVSALLRIYDPLIESFYGIQWVRFIDGHAEGIADAEGQRLLFSTYAPDILNHGEAPPVYAAYNEPDIPYEIVAVPEDGAPKYTFIERPPRVILSFPLYDSFDIYWGTALFSLSIDAISVRLAGEGKIGQSEDITVLSNPTGLLLGSEGNFDPDGPRRKVLLSTVSSHGFLVGRLVNEEVFLLPTVMKILLLLAFFLTAYLIIFLLFNLRQDPLVVVQNRLKQLQISLIEQFYERKGEADWARWIRELEHRREEIRTLLKRGVKVDAEKSAVMDILINSSWDELLAMLGSRRVPSNLSAPGETSTASSINEAVDIDEEKIASVLQKLLEARTGASAPPPAVPTVAEEGIEVLEELDGAEELDTETEAEKDESFDEKLKIVSPFSEMVFDLSPPYDDGAAEGGPKNESKDLSIALAGGLPIITRPFSDISGDEELESLEVLDAATEGDIDGNGDIIREKEGVHYISEGALAPSRELTATLNRQFKELVDSVTK